MKPFILALALLAGCGQSLAGDYSFITLNKSWHYKLEGQNENHQGIGLEYRTGNHIRLSGIYFKNSFNNQSFLFSATKNYIQYSNINIGLVAGFATGYEKTKVVAGVSVEYKYIRLVITPILTVVGFAVPLNF